MKNYKAMFVMALFCLMLFGCSDKSTDKTEDTASADSEDAEEEKGLSLENDGVDEELFKEAIAEFPDGIKETVITSSVPISEILHGLGITPAGIPSTPYELPEEFADIPEIGTSMAPDIEVITSIGAEFFIGSDSVKDSLDEHLKNINLETAYLGTENLDQIKLAIKVLGTYFNKETEMNDMLTDILSWENTLIEKGETLDKQKALLIIGMSDSFMVMNNNTYLGSILERTNIDNVAETAFKSEETYAAINMENIIQANPDTIFVLAFSDAEKVKDDFMKELEKNEAWKSIDAYKNDNIQFLDYDVYGVSSIRNMETALTGITDILEATEKNE